MTTYPRWSGGHGGRAIWRGGEHAIAAPCARAYAPSPSNAASTAALRQLVMYKPSAALSARIWQQQRYGHEHVLHLLSASLILAATPASAATTPCHAAIFYL